MDDTCDDVDFDWDDFLCCVHFDISANSGGNRNGRFPWFSFILVTLLICFAIFYYRSQI